MNVLSVSFLAFLAAVSLLCPLAARRSPKAGMGLFGLACLVFYLAGDQRGIWVLLAGVAVSIGATNYLVKERPQTQRRRVLALAAAWHIGVLLCFKYTDFFTGGAITIGWSPLGLSFFTFQQLWLLKEAYTREFPPPSAGEVALFGFFFPTVVSGPIPKPSVLLPQLKKSRFLHPTWEDTACGLYGICTGISKKALLADPLGVVVDNGWAHLSELSAPAAWLVILGYTLQLYFDFSGSGDIATGCGRLLGLRLLPNFNSPYRALSVTDFWKRWHIALTTFLRECLYFPLGGSRKGTARTCANILLVFLISGFWHGAGWTFLIWGGLHGLAQITERLLGDRPNHLPRLLRWAITFAFVNVAWVFFRAPDLGSALELLSTALTGGFAKPEAWLLTGLLAKEGALIQLFLPSLEPWLNILRVVLLYGAGILVVLWPQNTPQKLASGSLRLRQVPVLAVLMLWSVLSFSGITTFIYANF